MRLLGIHADGFRFEARERASKAAEELYEGFDRTSLPGDALVVFLAIENGDDTDATLIPRVTADIRGRAKALAVDRVVVYPYVHLAEDPAPPRLAVSALRRIAEHLEPHLDVVRAPFGWYKAFELRCLGHPLSEWSARYRPGHVLAEEPPSRQGSEFTRYVIASPDGETFEVTPDDFASCRALDRDAPSGDLLRAFVRNELAGREDTGKEPPHVDYMRRHELVDYCDVSEKGHFKWYPKGVLLRRLVLDYAADLARDWGAFEMANPVLIKADSNAVGELMGEFHERDYRVDGGRGIGYLRYASDPLGFPFLQKVRFSHRQTPLKVYEETSCFRNEQEGEVSGLKRVRNFTMTDMHAACASVDEARPEFEALCARFGQLMNDVIAPNRWVLGWEGTIDFFEANRDWLVRIGVELGVPAFFKLMPEMSHYYAMKNEYQAITADGSNVQVCTVQWDVKDGERFDIGFFDEEGRKHPCPVILHASSFGSIERTFCAMLESIAIDARKGKAPMFPVWLSPSQVRILPVSDDHLSFAETLCETLSAKGIRCEVDDRDDTVGRKIRNGERDWVPYLVVVGDRERDTGDLSVRVRSDRTQITCPVSELVDRIENEIEGMPRRPLALPQRMSRHPIFFG